MKMPERKSIQKQRSNHVRKNSISSIGTRLYQAIIDKSREECLTKHGFSYQDQAAILFTMVLLWHDQKETGRKRLKWDGKDIKKGETQEGCLMH